ncbi:Actin cross-linking toxin VgrG1 [Oligella sp. MSHR50489EDL]
MGAADPEQRYWRYEAVVRPNLWLATLNRNFRIFQHLSTQQIVEQVLEPYDLICQFNLTESHRYELCEYCVQYDESDFNFISRLLALDGIHYQFKHFDDRHEVHFYDSNEAHPLIEGYETIDYLPDEVLGLHAKRHYISHWQSVRQLHSSHFETSHYNYRNPYQDLRNYAHHAHRYLPVSRVYEWPGNYYDWDKGEHHAERRLHYFNHLAHQKSCSTTALALTTGARFTLCGYPRSEENAQYLVVETRFHLRENPYHSTEQARSGRIAELYLTVQRADEPYYPPQQHPKPKTYGPQTAVVVGPEGQEIWTNDLGQVKVKFFWDRYGRGDENSSCRIRVSHPWAGAGHGAIQIPRIGDEVIVDFLNGDPDYPVITGRVYNRGNVPPWRLPEHATQMGFFSRSSPDGDRSTANIFRFEDKTGQEQIYIHAERDMDTEVKRNETLSVQQDRIKNVHRDEITVIGKNCEETVGETLRIQAGQLIEWRCGSAYIQLHPDGLVRIRGLRFGLPSEVSKPGRLQDTCITLTKGKIIRMARALRANGRV